MFSIAIKIVKGVQKSSLFDIGLNRTVITSLFLRFHAGDFLPAFALVVRGLRVAHVHLF